MAKNKPTPLKDEPVMSLDDISTKLDNLAASIGALQKEPCEPVKVWGSITKNRKMLISRSYTKKGNFPIGRCFRQFTRRLAPFQMIIIMCQTL